MKRKIKTIAAFVVLLLLCLQTVTFAATNESNNLIFTKVKELGLNVIVENNAQKPTGTQIIMDGAVENIAYCVDAQQDLVANSKYSIVNMEDSGYISVVNAKKVRAILMNSYPYITLSEMQSRSGKTILTVKEAITATQLAIWKLTNGKDYAPYLWPNYGEIARCTALRDWLLTLAGTEAASTVSDIEIKSFYSNNVLNIAYRATHKNPNGSNIDLSHVITPTSVTEDGGIDAEGYTHVLVKNPTSSVSISVSGTQTILKDAYFYKPEGGKTVSQCMAGVKEGSTLITKKATIPLGATGGIKIIKVDSATNAKLANVEFMLSQSQSFAEPTYTITTNANGIAEKTGLYAGTWYIKETKRLGNYMPIDGFITVSVGESITELTVKNTPYSKIKILKVSDTNSPLGGAKFNIYSGTDITATPLYQGLISDQSGLILQGLLVAGKYTIVETDAPYGYERDYNPVTIDLLVGETKEVRFINKPLKGIMHILKYDAVSKEQLQGAVFSICDDAAATHELTRVTSLKDAPVIIDSLKPGTYYVKEVSVPSGYLLDPNIKSVVIEANKTTVVEFFNTRGIPTAGNYATILFGGIIAISICALGWAVLFVYKKKKFKK